MHDLMSHEPKLATRDMICQPRGQGQPLKRRVQLCGIGIDPLTMSEVVSCVEDCLNQGRTLAIGVVNVAKVVNMQRDNFLRESVLSSDLVLADGAPLVWLSRLKRTPLPERVAGIDLMFELFSLADARRFRVFLLGATRQTIERAVQIARRDYPSMIIAGYRDGYFDASQEQQVAQAIRDAQADMLFVAMTSPKKEIFMKKWGRLMNVAVCHGVGGSFDVMAGVTRRAPRWMQRAGLEWFYRVMQEPRRMWRRYLVTNVRFVGLVLADLFGRSK
jgi:N-acetylglucosaminyldiphosphoundecaprenol N-acetyl-beta-D-mannosaminyltransferase